MPKFSAKHIPFKDGLDRIAGAFKRAKVRPLDRILTSRDKDAVVLCNLLRVKDSDLPKGFRKWQLPFHMEGGQFFITAAKAGSTVGLHSHDENGLRVIMSGSITFEGIELSAGDWMFIPKGKPYSFQTGPLGASMFYCYKCCCAGRELNFGQEVINPASYVRTRISGKALRK